MFNIINGDSAEILKTFDDNTFDSVVTDPPYGIGFLHKEWDSNTGTVELWQEVYRVLKPGAYLLAFSAPRTYHYLASNLEAVGFEIKDQLMWLYASGFPKGQDIGKGVQKALGVKEWGDEDCQPDINGSNLAKSHEGGSYGTVNKKKIIITDDEAKEWEGWNTGLKPAHEPIVMARKPTVESAVNNVRVYGVGALNINACSIPDPANDNESRFPSNVIGEIEEGYQKYFYCPKVSKQERHLGLSVPPNAPARPHKGAIFANDNASPFKARDNQFGRLDNLGASQAPDSNTHPTVKPVDLMAYLVRLVTPQGGKVLDPFSGSGSTGLGCILEGADYTGIELDPQYVEISEARMAAQTKATPKNAKAQKATAKKSTKKKAAKDKTGSFSEEEWARIGVSWPDGKSG